MKNYYEILEVDRNASEEVIEKAYKTLAKKYHPDLQNNSNCQNKMQQINEAYEILSNDFKRREYDEKLQRQTISVEEYNRIVEENNRLKQNLQQATLNNESNLNQIDSLQFARRYYNQLKRGSKQPQMQYNRRINISFEKVKKLIIYLLIIIIIVGLLAVIPVTRKFFINLYNTNTAVKLIVDIIVGTFSRGF